MFSVHPGQMIEPSRMLFGIVWDLPMSCFAVAVWWPHLLHVGCDGNLQLPKFFLTFSYCQLMMTWCLMCL